MDAFKAPGSDGIQAHFFHTQWNLVGVKVCELVKECLQDPEHMKKINQATIVMIPKNEQPSGLKDFRPISLCNVSFKIITKLLARRLQQVMDFLIDPHQCSFIKGRQSCDNIIIAQEAIHTMRRKKTGRSYMAIKVDMEKAFDRLDWDFIEQTLHIIGLDNKLIRIIVNCISTTSLRVLWNGEGTETFRPSRGVRQGDPLSPYIFVLCMERLSFLIKDACVMKKWKPLRFSSRGPFISHLFFADDLILFAEASFDQMHLIKDIMAKFCLASGHKINLTKSKAFSSKNVHFNRGRALCQILGIDLTADLGKYLGVPLIHSRVTKLTFTPILQKVQQKLSSWQGPFLNIAGRSVLIKSILSVVPYYFMQSLLIPKGIIKEIEGYSKRFLWSQNPSKRKMHLIS